MLPVIRPKYVVTYFYDPSLNTVTCLRIGKTPCNLFKHIADLARNFKDFMIMYYKSHCPAIYVKYVSHFSDYDIEFRIIKSPERTF